MTNKLILPGLLLLLSSYAFGQKEKEYKVIAVGFYNCENFFDTIHDPNKKDQETTPTPKIYVEKQHNIATVLEKIGTDITPDGAAIIGLAEVENDNVLKDLIAQPELSKRHYKYEWFYTPDERGISTAMLYNPKYLKVISANPIHVATESLPAKRPTRDILHVFGVMAGDSVHIFVNHWPSKAGGEAASAPGRILAATRLKHVVDSLQKDDPDTKIMILGDFNDNPNSEGISEVLKAKADKDAVELTDIYNPWINMYKKGQGTEYYAGEWNLIDQIMISGSFIKNMNKKWKYYSNEIYNRDFLTLKLGNDKGLPHRSYNRAKVWDHGYSDHFPVLMYFIEKK